MFSVYVAFDMCRFKYTAKPVYKDTFGKNKNWCLEAGWHRYICSLFAYKSLKGLFSSPSSVVYINSCRSIIVRCKPEQNLAVLGNPLVYIVYTSLF